MNPRLFMFACLAAAAVHGANPAETMPEFPHATAKEFRGVDPDILKMLEKFRNRNCRWDGTPLKLLEKKTSCC